MDKVIINLRAVASILQHMSYAEDNVQDRDFALSFLSSQILACVDELISIENKE